MFRVPIYFVIALAVALQGCIPTASVPALEGPLDQPFMAPKSVYVTEVVQRVKCELYYAVLPYLPPHSKIEGDKISFATGDQNHWLGDWGATAHLELVLNDQGAITPGVTYTTVPATFSIGAGGGLSGQASRIDDVQFSISIKELVAEFADPTKKAHYKFCSDSASELGDAGYLRSNLGLKEWVASALGPTDCYSEAVDETHLASPTLCSDDDGFRYLRMGAHKVISAAKLAAPAVIQPKPMFAEKQLYPPTDVTAKKVKALHDDLNNIASDVDHNLQFITKLDQKKCPNATSSFIDKYIYLLHQIKADTAKANKELSLFTPKGDDGVEFGIYSQAVNYYQVAANDVRKAQAAIEPVASCKITTVKQGLQDPLDNISHTVAFVIAENINVTPSWMFARVKTATSPALASLTHNNTQTLSIVLGPENSTQATASDVTLRAVLRQTLVQPLTPF